MGHQGLVAGFRFALGQPRDGAAQLDRLLGQPCQKRLLRAHALSQGGQALDQRGVGNRRLFAALLAAAERAGEIVKTIGGAFQQRLDIGGDALFAFGLEGAAREARGARQPFLELGMEAALGLARLQFEEAQHE